MSLSWLVTEFQNADSLRSHSLVALRPGAPGVVWSDWTGSRYIGCPWGSLHRVSVAPCAPGRLCSWPKKLKAQKACSELHLDPAVPPGGASVAVGDATARRSGERRQKSSNPLNLRTHARTLRQPAPQSRVHVLLTLTRTNTGYTFQLSLFFSWFRGIFVLSGEESEDRPTR